jgi:hypothetical protein
MFIETEIGEIPLHRIVRHLNGVIEYDRTNGVLSLGTLTDRGVAQIASLSQPISPTVFRARIHASKTAV